MSTYPYTLLARIYVLFFITQDHHPSLHTFSPPLSFFFFKGSGDPRVLPFSPPRPSSDLRIHFDRPLVVRPADTARLHLEARLHVVERLLEHLERVVTGPLLDDVEALVEDAFGRALLAVAHHGVDELGHQRAAVDRVGGQFALRDFSSTWHCFLVARTSGACGRTSIDPACVPGRRRHPAFRARRDSARRAHPSRGLL